MPSIEQFKDYLRETRLTFSYKAVLVLALIEVIDAEGKTTSAQLVSAFHHFYLDRQARGLEVEKGRDVNPTPLLHPQEVTPEQIWQILVRYPLDLMKAFIAVKGDDVQIHPQIWANLDPTDLDVLREIAQQRLDAYYAI